MSVDLADGNRIEYIIDGQNRRIGKKGNSSLTQGFLYDDQLRIVSELDSAGSVISRFVYATKTNVPDYFIQGTTTYQIISDHLGSPRLIINADTGDLLQQIEYDEFGRVTSDSLPGFQPFGFAGGLYDADTRLVRFGARDYDAEAGRWLSKDPILFSGKQSNLYSYSFSDPVNFLDSNGMDVWIEGPNGPEPAFHQSVCVGNPNGVNQCFSFGVNGQGILQGQVYRDTSSGGTIEQYKITIATQDAVFLEQLNSEVGNLEIYGVDDICRSYSQRKFNEAPGVPSVAPYRPPTNTPSTPWGSWFN